MVQVIEMPKSRRSLGEAFGGGLEKGIGQAASMALQVRMQDMLEAKQQARSQSNILRAAEQLAASSSQGNPELKERLAPVYASLGMVKPEMMMQFHNAPMSEKMALLNDFQSYQSQASPSMKEMPSFYQKQSANQQAPQTQQAPTQAQSYPMQTGYNQQGPQSAIHSANVNPLVFPDRQAQMQQPAPNGAVSGMQPQIQAQQSRPSEEERFMTVPGPRGPMQMVRSLDQARNIGEARDFIRYFSPQKEWNSQEKLWIDAQNLKTRQKKSEIEEKKLRREEEKAPREYIKEINQKYEATLRKRPIFKIMEEKAGEVKSSAVYRKWLSDRWGLPAGAALTNVEQILDKLGNQLIQGVSGSFDQARILQTEVETFIKANPSLLNTPEGLQKIARISMAMDDLAEEKWKYKNELVKKAKENGEQIPEDLENRVLEKEPEFIENITKKIHDIMAQEGITSKFSVGTKVERSDLKNLSVGTVVRNSENGKMYRKTINGMEEVSK